MADRVKYHSNLYLGNDISSKKLDKIIKKLHDKPLFCNSYLIALAENQYDQLEIFRANQLAQKYYEKYPVYVVGIASDYDDAVALVERIVKECLQSRGDCNIKEFLLCPL
ncbi:MAG: hypothetical protein K6G30_06360 [Acetatifactor sp.]|nr:hypothetical protein [Acetatifactor sp.]